MEKISFRIICIYLIMSLFGCGGSSSSVNETNDLQVDAGEDRVVLLTDSLDLDATVQQSDTIVSVDWSKETGPGTVTFSDNKALAATAAFSDVGSYVLRLTVQNSETSFSDSIEITVNQAATGTSGLAGRPENGGACVAPAQPPEISAVRLDTPFPSLPSLNAPLAMYMAPADTMYWYLVQQGGQVLRFLNNNTVSSASTFVDINDSRLSSGGERGLLGMAFHPQFASNGYVYLSYTSDEAGLVSRISRFDLDENGQQLDVDSEQIILSVEQPFGNHNGGQIAFGPDGYLYVGLGDGGSGGDPLGHGQNTQSLLGSMLRIDVGDGTSTSYTIPEENPFVDGGGAEEVYAYGLRNPWRWSFDREEGTLWLGDVGQGQYEEINIISKGGNYGWNIMEAGHCFESSSCDQTGFVLPVTEYDHSEGFSVTGGYVYRGDSIAFLRGQYLYGDFGSGKVWGLTETAPGEYTSEELLTTNLNIASFAEDHYGELYVIGLGGEIRQIVADQSSEAGEIPQQLSQWECFDENTLSRFSNRVIPYDINALLWSDHTDKTRFMAIPDGTTVDVDQQGRLEFPVGSVLGKNFWLDNRIIETRLLLHHESPHGWKGYSYEWNDEENEATLLNSAKDVTIQGQAWHYPSQSECDLCHTAVAGFTLGPEVAQLNRQFVYPSTDLQANQLITLEESGVMSSLFSSEDKAAVFYALDDERYSTRLRARSYLHSNCANCHQPGGPGGGGIDLRMTTSLTDAGLCGRAPSGTALGLTQAVLLAPGEPDRSVMVLRMEHEGEFRMPPLATNEIDTQAMVVVRDWIANLETCP